MLGSDGALTYCNAGHNAPLLVSPSGIRRLETGGTVLGLFEAASYEEETVRLSPGDIIVAFSDGVTEAMNPAGDEFTDERLLACAEAHRGESPQRMLDALLADVHTFCEGATQSDDVTAVLVRYNG
jgi:sigma-B regulation protein RsbU (phosphoserine phosphatase)